LGYVIQDEPAPPGSVSLRCRVRTVAGMTLSTMETSSLKAAVLAYLGDAATPTGGEAGAEEQRSVALGS
jgi:hypothetical protein